MYPSTFLESKCFFKDSSRLIMPALCLSCSFGLSACSDNISCYVPVYKLMSFCSVFSLFYIPLILVLITYMCFSNFM